MSKRPAVNMLALTTETSEEAVPMFEAVQRTATPTADHNVAKPTAARTGSKPGHVGTANLEALAFKVSPDFRRRFRSRAVAADLKLNELLFAALDAWETQQGLNK